MVQRWVVRYVFMQCVMCVAEYLKNGREERLRQTVSEGEWKLIREAVQLGHLTADKKFEKETSKKKRHPG